MHEFSICQSLVETALSELENVKPRPEKVIRMTVVVGALRQIMREQLAFAYDVLTKDTIAQDSLLDIEYVPVSGKCRKCSWEGPLEIPVLHCPECESADVAVVTGKELYLKQVEIEDNE